MKPPFKCTHECLVFPEVVLNSVRMIHLCVPPSSSLGDRDNIDTSIDNFKCGSTSHKVARRKAKRKSGIPSAAENGQGRTA